MASTLPSLALLRHTSAPSPVGNFTNPWAAEMRDREAGDGGAYDMSALQRQLEDAQKQAEAATEALALAKEEATAATNATKKANKANANAQARATRAQMAVREARKAQRDARRQAEKGDQRSAKLTEEMNKLNEAQTRLTKKLKECNQENIERQDAYNRLATSFVDQGTKEAETYNDLVYQIAVQERKMEYLRDLRDAVEAYIGSDDDKRDLNALERAFDELVEKMQEELRDVVDAKESDAVAEGVDEGN